MALWDLKQTTCVHSPLHMIGLYLLLLLLSHAAKSILAGQQAMASAHLCFIWFRSCVLTVIQLKLRTGAPSAAEIADSVFLFSER